MGGDKPRLRSAWITATFQSTPPVWAETLGCRRAQSPSLISIHSARVGGDIPHRVDRLRCLDFNPLRPCGRRLLYSPCASSGSDFNPLRPCGRRLPLHRRWNSSGGFQSTPPVWAETISLCMRSIRVKISIHSARVGGDLLGGSNGVNGNLFQSTPPVWAETSFVGSRLCERANFNPLRPCGRRPG